MTSGFRFFAWAATIMQWLTGAVHSMSFFVAPEAKNETEKTIIDLTHNYRPDAGMGFPPSFSHLFFFITISFALLCLFAGSINAWFLKKDLSAGLWNGFLLIQTLVFGILFLAMVFFTFFPPILCTGLIFVFLLCTLFSVK